MRDPSVGILSNLHMVHEHTFAPQGAKHARRTSPTRGKGLRPNAPNISPVTRRRRLVALLGALFGTLLMTIAPATTARAIDLTGDVQDPVLRSFTISPAEGDVTSGPASFTITWRLTDDKSGVAPDGTNVTWSPPNNSVSYGMNVARISGDDLDGTYRAVMTVPTGFPPGRYTVWLTFGDKAGNGRSYPPTTLAAEGFPNGVDITSANADTTAPAFGAIRVSPARIDARAGSASATVEVDASDAGSGIRWVVVFFHDRNGGGGGHTPPHMTLASGTASRGTWRGTLYLPEHTTAGQWTAEVRLFDRVDNTSEVWRSAVIDVLSNEDVVPPDLHAVSIWPPEVNVHDADQEVKVRVRASDVLAGIMPIHDTYNVQVYATDDATGQSTGRSGMYLVDGDGHDGWFEIMLPVPKSAATGLRTIDLFATDRLGNRRHITGADVVALGGPVGLLVYNVPLPPQLVDVAAIEGGVRVRWNAPLDDRGAAITGYVVRTNGGIEVRAPADARHADITGLAPGSTHSFTVSALNKAGASDPSSAATAKVGAAGGYWMVGRTGSVYAFGGSRWLGNTPIVTSDVVDLEPTPSRNGYWIATAAGDVFAFGDAGYHGGASGLQVGERVTSISSSETGRGYWLFTSRGRVIARGDAPFLGDVSGIRLNGPVLDSIPTPSGNGYYMVASDGGVFPFGDARYVGSMGATRLNAPVQSLVPDADGAGYWLVASDGGIFSFDAPFHGSMGAVRLNRPITGMVGSPTGRGYLMVGEDGGIFAFGDVAYHGSLGASPPAVPITSVASF